MRTGDRVWIRLSLSTTQHRDIFHGMALDISVDIRGGEMELFCLSLVFCDLAANAERSLSAAEPRKYSHRPVRTANSESGGRSQWPHCCTKPESDTRRVEYESDD